MSLILRKACQPVLDKVNLADFHIIINEDNKYMEVVGECGKPLFSITGIRFSRMSPTKEEIDYAKDLLKEFFIVHKVKLKEYFIALNKFSRIKLFKLEKDFYIKSNYSGINIEFKIKHKDMNTSISYNIDTKLFTYDCSKATSVAKIVIVANNKLIVEKLIKYAENLVIYNKAEEEYNEVLNSLQTCEI